MEPLTDGRDVLAVLPTGAGKSAIYQVPALLLDGPTVVVSPLIALQRDQREGLADTEAPDAVVVNSAQRAAQTRRAWEKLRDGSAEYVFLSPEQLANDEIVDALRGRRRLAVRRRRGALRLRVGARLPAGLPAAGPGDRAARAPAGGRADRDGRSADPRTTSWPGWGCATPAEVVACFDRPNLHLTAHLFHDDDQRRREVVERAVELVGELGGRGRPGLLRHPQGHRRLRRRAARPRRARGGLPRRDEGRRPRRGARAVPRRRARRGGRDVGVRDGHRQAGRPVRACTPPPRPRSTPTTRRSAGPAATASRPTVTLLHHAKDLNLQRFLTARRPKPGALRAVLDALSPRPSRSPRRSCGQRAGLGPARATAALNLLEQAGAVLTGPRRRACTAASCPSRRRGRRARARSPSSIGTACGRASR